MLRFCDSFDHYATAQIGQKWTTLGAGGSIAAGGRHGSRLQLLSATGAVTKTLDAQQTWIVGVAIFSADVGSPSTNPTGIIALLDAGTVQMDVRMNDATNRQLTITRNGTVLATGTTSLALSTWYFIEFKVFIHDTTGTAELKINGVTELSLTNVDTKNTANASANAVRLGAAGASSGGTQATWLFDDFYVCDGQGATNNNFLGDVRVEAIFPDGNGNSSQMLGSDGNSTDNYLLVDEATPNDDTDYVSEDTVDQKDTYAYGSVTPGSGTVHGVQVLPYARKTDAGARSIKSVARVSGTEEDSATKVLSMSYLYLSDIRETKPGGGAWSISDVNGAEFGVKLVA